LLQKKLCVAINLLIPLSHCCSHSNKNTIQRRPTPCPDNDQDSSHKLPGWKQWRGRGMENRAEFTDLRPSELPKHKFFTSASYCRFFSFFVVPAQSTEFR